MVREADSFTKLCELQKDYDQDSYCWKTYQHSLFGGLETYSERWPRSGMIRSGIAYRLRPLPVRPTSETGFLYWLTPGSLSEQVVTKEFWPTPTGMTGGTKVAPSHRNGTHGWNLGAAVNDSLSSKPIHLWPTPRASEYKDCGPLGSKSYRHMLDRHYLCAKAQEADNITGKLNPTWVEWLMGFPSGWTELDE